jgi:hypothetical protein
MIDNQAGIFHVQDFHDVLPAVNKDEYFSTTDILVHVGTDNTAKGIKALSHVKRYRVKVVFQRLMKVEHERQS